MTPTLDTHGWYYYNWGNVASAAGLAISLLGLGFTIWTLITAKSAKRAANEARDAAGIRLVVDEARRGEYLSRELANHLAGNRYEVAIVRAQDLADLLLAVYEFWTDTFDETQRAVVFDAKNDADQVVAILRRVSESNIQPSSREALRVRAKVDGIYESFVKMRASIEQKRTNK